MNEAVEAALKLLVLAFSIIMHEVAHGYAAYLLGDPTAKNANRLTLNPIPHIDIMGTIILPLLLVSSGSGVVFGWAKPVPVDPRYFRNPKRDGVVVSLAGVTTNVLIAVVMAALFRILQPAADTPLWLFLIWGCFINLLLCVFNMVPIPPLDGSHIVAALLPQRLARGYAAIGRFGFLIIFGLLYIRAFAVILMIIVTIPMMVLLGDGQNWTGIFK
jgi:Zn-dependent protease